MARPKFFNSTLSGLAKCFFRSFLVAVALASCAPNRLQVGDVDLKTGQIVSRRGNIPVAEVRTDKAADLAKFKGTAYVTGMKELGSAGKEQIAASGYFDRVIDHQELLSLIVREGLTDEISEVRTRIDVHRVYRKYRPFLWIDMGIYHRDGAAYQYIAVMDPETSEDLLLADVPVGFMTIFDEDREANYPLLNALFNWIRKQLDRPVVNGEVEATV